MHAPLAKVKTPVTSVTVWMLGSLCSTTATPHLLAAFPAVKIKDLTPVLDPSLTVL